MHDTTDATKWADEWLTTIGANPTIPQDRGTMIDWFANAIMAGYDHGRRAEERRWISAGVKFPSEPTHGDSANNPCDDCPVKKRSETNKTK